MAAPSPSNNANSTQYENDTFNGHGHRREMEMKQHKNGKKEIPKQDIQEWLCLFGENMLTNLVDLLMTCNIHNRHEMAALESSPTWKLVFNGSLMTDSIADFVNAFVSETVGANNSKLSAHKLQATKAMKAALSVGLEIGNINSGFAGEHHMLSENLPAIVKTMDVRLKHDDDEKKQARREELAKWKHLEREMRLDMEEEEMELERAEGEEGEEQRGGLGGGGGADYAVEGVEGNNNPVIVVDEDEFKVEDYGDNNGGLEVYDDGFGDDEDEKNGGDRDVGFPLHGLGGDGNNWNRNDGNGGNDDGEQFNGGFGGDGRSPFQFQWSRHVDFAVEVDECIEDDEI